MEDRKKADDEKRLSMRRKDERRKTKDERRRAKGEGRE
jgi:hypothetical protein